jgi:hypothetical protein
VLSGLGQVFVVRISLRGDVNVGAHRSVARSLVRVCGLVAAGRDDTGASRLCRTSPVLALSAAVMLALFAGVAQAEPPKLVSYGNFAGPTGPMGVAIDQSSSDVYVAGFLDFTTANPSHVNKFDASGTLLAPPSPFGEARNSGAAVNPINGDLYVLDSLSSVIDVYDPSSGALLSSFSVPMARNFGPFAIVQIATDNTGDVYLPVTVSNEVQEYSSTGTLLKTITGSGASALKGPTGVAVDSIGDVWVVDAGNNRIEEFNPAGAPIAEINSEGVQSVALAASGDVFAIVNNSVDFCGKLAPPCIHVVEYSSAGAQLADIGAGSLGEAAENPRMVPSMLAVNDSTGRVYATDATKNLVWIYGPPTAPAVSKELAVEVGTSEAKLGALATPGGIETSYHFEYGSTTAYGQTTPFPDGNVGQGVTSHVVWAAASGLAPGTTYHYRVVATNELGTVVGPDQTFTTETSAQAACPNEQLRSGFAASLPDCRAYELVTPPTKTSTQPDPFWDISANLAARDGNRMAYRSIDILPGSQTAGETYVSTRGASGWSSENMIPLQAYTALECPYTGHVAGTDMLGYSADLSKGVLLGGSRQRASEGTNNNGGCDAEPVEVVSGEPQGYKNLLLRDNTDNGYQLINLTPPNITPADAHFDGASSDLSHVVFDEHAQLTSRAPAGVDDLYEWTGGVVRLVTVLPNGDPAVGSLAGGLEHNRNADTHAVSADGSHIFFTAGANLYVRVSGEHTAQVDESRGGTGPGGGGQFEYASADGSQVLFTDGASAGLTSDTDPGSGKNLYRYAAGQLTDLTPGSHAEVVGVSGASDDGSYVYFVATGVLSGSQTNRRGETAQAGQPNLYLWHGGTTTFIATLSGGDNALSGGVRMSPNGAFVAFVSHRSLTGYDNVDTVSGQPDPEIYLYNAARNSIVCASCNPSGESPAAGGATFLVEAGGVPHYLSDSGQVFFNTTEALLPSDTNSQVDVYEYQDGQVHLISTGTSSSESVLIDASESGNDVFFLTRQKLVPQDTEEEARNIYDARVNGGFAAPSSPPPCSTADSCRSASSPQPSIYGAPSSQTFLGAGNLTPPSEVKPKTKAKPKKNKVKKACKRNKHKQARCTTRARRARAIAKSHKGGK